MRATLRTRPRGAVVEVFRCFRALRAARLGAAAVPLAFASAALVSVALVPVAHAQSWGQVAGRVTDTAGQGVAGANVVVERTNFGTTADADGHFSMRIPTGRYRLRITAIGYRTVIDSVEVRRDQPAALSVRMADAAVEGQEVEVVGQQTAGAGVFVMRPQDVQDMPGPFRGAFQAIRALPGVSANNELSNQFSVRGGGLSENLIFLNGFEVYLPFRPKQGEQEGLGILNPDLTESLTLYAGGFPARYGGKLASALDVRYAAPAPGSAWHGNVNASLLDGSASVAGAAGPVGVAVGVRHAQPGRFYNTQDTKGRYTPAFTDVQGTVTWPVSRRVSVEGVGLYASHRFRLSPSSRQVTYGYVSQSSTRPSNLQRLYTNFSGSERDGFTTAFGGLRVVARPTTRLTVEHGVSLYDTDEFERSNIFGSANISQIDPGTGQQTDVLGIVESADSSNNDIRVRTLTGHGRYGVAAGRHAAEAGWQLRALRFEDRIQEFAAQTQNGTTEIAKDLNDALTLRSTQAALYVQDAFDVLPDAGRLVATAGVRADHFALTGEWTVSPRLALRYRASPVTTVTGSAGLYYQPPSYQELRGDLAADSTANTIERVLNRDLKSQRSLQVVAGAEHFLTRARLWLRGEAYVKALSNVISYDVDNVRVRYSGDNDAEARVGGFDVQVRGEFVPGLESWINYGFLVAQERVLDAYATRFTEGWRSRPTDQRHTLSMFVQDYVPGNDVWRLHLRGLFGSGYAYTPLVPGGLDPGGSFLVPGPRNALRYDPYKRVDAGVTRELTFGATRLDVTAELLNVFDMVNEVASQWVFAGGKWTRVPVRLTPRTVNLRARWRF